STSTLYRTAGREGTFSSRLSHQGRSRTICPSGLSTHRRQVRYPYFVRDRAFDGRSVTTRLVHWRRMSESLRSCQPESDRPTVSPSRALPAITDPSTWCPHSLRSSAFLSAIKVPAYRTGCLIDRRKSSLHVLLPHFESWFESPFISRTRFFLLIETSTKSISIWSFSISEARAPRRSCSNCR